MKLIRRRDYLWLRLAALVDPPFRDGVHWAISANRFAALQGLKLVEPQTQPDGHVRAVATEAGFAFLAKHRASLAAKSEKVSDHG